MLTCKEASRLLSQSMDRSLPRMKRLELRVHVWLCSGCSNFEKQLLLLKQAARRLNERDTQPPSVKLGDEARERIRKAVCP
jgi:hypothetical protein